MGQLWLHSLVIFIVLFLRNIQAQRTGNAFFTSFPFFRRPRPGSSVFDDFTISLTVRVTEEGMARVHDVGDCYSAFDFDFVLKRPHRIKCQLIL